MEVKEINLDDEKIKVASYIKDSEIENNTYIDFEDTIDLKETIETIKKGRGKNGNKS